jgi:glutathione S-transferase
MILAYGGVEVGDLAVWGKPFHTRKTRGDFPWGKTPVLEMGSGFVIAQSGALARYAGRVTNIYGGDLFDPIACARSDSVFELAQELCTINPLVNCYVGQQFVQIQKYYFSEVIPPALAQLELELWRVQDRNLTHVEHDAPFFAGASPGIGDFNVFHHLNNAELLEPDLLSKFPTLAQWSNTMANMPSLAGYLEKRPVLNGIGDDPGLEDRNGTRITQRSPIGQAWLSDGIWILSDHSNTPTATVHPPANYSMHE